MISRACHVFKASINETENDKKLTKIREMKKQNFNMKLELHFIEFERIEGLISKKSN